MKIGRRSFVHSTLMAAGGLLVPAHIVWAKGGHPGLIPASLPAISGSGKPISLTGADLKDLRASLKGKLILPQDEGYDAARQYWDSALTVIRGLS